MTLNGKRSVLAIASMCVVLFTLTDAHGADVRFDKTIYSINFSKDTIEFREQGFHKKVVKKKCNKTVFELFEKRWKRNTDLLVDIKNSEKLTGIIRVSIDKKEKYALRFTDAGKYFSDLPSLAKNLWFTTERLCRK